MTPEERLTQIENLLKALTENQVHFEASAEARQLKADEETAELRGLQKGVVVAIGKLAEYQRETDAKLNILIQAQTETEHKLQRWIEHTGNEPQGAQ